MTFRVINPLCISEYHAPCNYSSKDNSTQAVAGLYESPEELIARLERVDREQVVAAAEKLALDTVYHLAGKEA